jgi:hypothetical protein
MTHELNEVSADNKKIYCENGRIPYSFFTEYIIDYIPKYIIKKLDKVYSQGLIEHNELYISSQDLTKI